MLLTLTEEGRTKYFTYLKRNARLKCRQCRRWMCFKPTKRTKLERRKPPRSNVCAECPVIG